MEVPLLLPPHQAPLPLEEPPLALPLEREESASTLVGVRTFACTEALVTVDLR